MSKFTTAQLKELNSKTVKNKLVKFILDKVLDILAPKFKVYNRLTVYKHTENSNLELIEPLDIVMGFNPQRLFVTARFEGGDPDDWDNYTILNTITN